jgi:hypothetical protein
MGEYSPSCMLQDVLKRTLDLLGLCDVWVLTKLVVPQQSLYPQQHRQRLAWGGSTSQSAL